VSTLPTPYPDLNTVLHELTDGVRSALDTAAVGIYLQGSFAIGDFDRHSDVDFVVVVEGELTELQVEVLQRLHARLYARDCSWAQHLEGSYFPRAVLRDLSHCGTPLWYLEHGSQSLSRDAHCNTLVVRWTVRACGISLLGPAPATLIDPIPVDDLRDEMRAEIHDWGRVILTEPDRFRNRFYQSFIVLTYCRMLRDLLAGDTGSKRAGARWAKINLDPRWGGLIDRAWGGRPDPARSVQQDPDPDDFQLTLEFVTHCIDLSSRLQLDGSA
jgi:hypothetical protein